MARPRKHPDGLTRTSFTLENELLNLAKEEIPNLSEFLRCALLNYVKGKNTTVELLKEELEEVEQKIAQLQTKREYLEREIEKWNTEEERKKRELIEYEARVSKLTTMAYKYIPSWCKEAQHPEDGKLSLPYGKKLNYRFFLDQDEALDQYSDMIKEFVLDHAVRNNKPTDDEIDRLIRDIIDRYEDNKELGVL